MENASKFARCAPSLSAPALAHTPPNDCITSLHNANLIATQQAPHAVTARGQATRSGTFHGVGIASVLHACVG